MSAASHLYQQVQATPIACLLEEYEQLQHQGIPLPHLISLHQTPTSNQYQHQSCNELCNNFTADNPDYSSWISTTIVNLETSNSSHDHDQQQNQAAASNHERKIRKSVYLKTKERRQRKWRNKGSMMEDDQVEENKISIGDISNEKGEKRANDQENSATCVYVRARRGQATDSHSLAERVRRKKISDRMKLLQSLVPGCDKIAGKALILDEIINYVQSLQNQVEFLMAKLASLDLTSSVNGVAVDLIAAQVEKSFAGGNFTCIPMPSPLYTMFSDGNCYAVPMSTWIPLLQDKENTI